ncbi:hypothetical protein J7F02_05865 [Streptomyces sp. ISL-112]|uniref:hypothetical protein n=1 Tax=unclassified Streptomyces TaxID=2593676 RepID=UPI001BE83732|nr:MULTISPECIES: hypothetical protein [unclassified Streptomyces]MBT2425223.1 hypothetical protein [Streptomyces sp. ISL-112]MBT2462014.1 hypothetical protein [Streptomyces sp. ISL-63]
MATTPNAIWIDNGGYATRITLPADPEQRVTVNRAITNSSGMEAVDLGSRFTMWIDETGGMLGSHRRPDNDLATRLAHHYNVTGKIRGPVVITGPGLALLTEEGLDDVEYDLNANAFWGAP